MPNCDQFQANIDRLQAQLATQQEVCNADLPPIEQRRCAQIIGGLLRSIKNAKLALQNCQAGLPAPGIRAATGQVTFLRVHDAGGFGAQSDFLDAEVIFKLDTEPLHSFGFQLRNDNTGPAHEGMLALLRDALRDDLDVTIDYRQELNKHNSVAFRLAVTGNPELSMIDNDTALQ